MQVSTPKSLRLTLSTFSAFADIENPVWQTQVLPDNYGGENCTNNHLIPVDSFPEQNDVDLEFGPEKPISNVIYQIWIGQKYLSTEFLALILSQGIKIQLWIDQPIEDFEAFEKMYDLLSEYPGFQVVYSPRLLYRSEEIFNLRLKKKLKSLTIHLHTKKNKFDSWLTIDQLWLRLGWFRDETPDLSVQYQIFDQDVRVEPYHVSEFLLDPSIKTYEEYSKVERPVHHLSQYISRAVLAVAGASWAEFLKLFLLWLRQPNMKNWQQFLGPIQLFVSRLELWRAPVLAKRYWSALNVWRFRVFLQKLWAAIALWRVRVFFWRVVRILKLRQRLENIVIQYEGLSGWRIPVAMRRIISWVGFGRITLFFRKIFSSLHLWRLPVLFQRFISVFQDWRVKILFIRAYSVSKYIMWNGFCYPFRKIFWFVKYQVDTRIIKKWNRLLLKGDHS